MKFVKFCLIFLFCIDQFLAQTTAEIQFADMVKNSDYFALPRENIHLHLNKNTYLTSETIWFKGYVFNKISNNINKETTNVYVSLYDANKSLVNRKFVLSLNGIFDNYIALNDEFTSGKYYIHVSTNFMNNFIEDESTLFAIEIINTKDKITLLDEIAIDNLTINIKPEGGNLVSGCDNTLGLSIRDCFGNGKAIKDIKILDQNNNLISLTSSNQFGYGYFLISDTKQESYKIAFEHQGQIIEKILPMVQVEGIVMTVYNNLLDKDILKLKLETNQKTLENISGKSFRLVIQQNQKIKDNLFVFDGLKKMFDLDNTIFFDGINFIRLLDKENNVIAERIVYHHNLKSEINYEKVTIKNDSIQISGNTGKKAYLSASVLPENTISNFNKNSIIASVTINNYLHHAVEDYHYYFYNYNRKKQFEFDLFLLNQPNIKYDWKNYLEKKVRATHPFELGFDIEVVVNNNISNQDKNKYEGFLMTTSGIFISEKLKDKNNFYYKNIFANDSTQIFFKLQSNNKTFNQTLNLYTRFYQNKHQFIKPINIENIVCNQKTYVRLASENPEFSISKETTILDNVDIVASQDELKNVNKEGNSFGIGLKIDRQNERRTLLQIIQQNGYEVNEVLGDFSIYNFGGRGISGKRTSPAIFLDDNPLFDVQFVRDIPIEQVDEIYFNKNDLSINSSLLSENDVEYQGTIKIYTDYTFRTEKASKGLKSFIISNGFSKSKSFTAPEYDYSSAAFQKYGVINWITNLKTDDSGNFTFKIPNLNQESVVINLQGFNEDGDLFYNHKILNISPTARSEE